MLSFLHGEEDTICFETLFKEEKICRDTTVEKKYVFEKAAKKIEFLNSQLITNPISGRNMK